MDGTRASKTTSMSGNGSRLDGGDEGIERDREGGLMVGLRKLPFAIRVRGRENDVVYTCLSPCMYVCMYVCMWTYMFVTTTFVCVCVCVCVISTSRENERCTCPHVHHLDTHTGSDCGRDRWRNRKNMRCSIRTVQNLVPDWKASSRRDFPHSSIYL